MKYVDILEYLCNSGTQYFPGDQIQCNKSDTWVKMSNQSANDHWVLECLLVWFQISYYF